MLPLSDKDYANDFKLYTLLGSIFCTAFPPYYAFTVDG